MTREHSSHVLPLRFPNRSHAWPSGAVLMEGHCANLANVVIDNRVVLQSAALADPEFESENGIGDFLDHAGAVGVVANAMEINAHGPADVCLEDGAQLAIHTLSTNCVHPPRLANQLFFSPPLTASLRPTTVAPLQAPSFLITVN